MIKSGEKYNNLITKSINYPKSREVSSKPPRSSNIEFLRILLIFCVITHHFCNSVPGALDYANGASYIFLRFLYSVTIMAVPAFLLITGYFMIDVQKVKIGKAISLFVLTSTYQVLLYIANSMFGESFHLRHFFLSFFPRNYYLYLYVAVFLLAPFINRTVRDISQKSYKTLMIISTLLFSVWSTVVNFIDVLEIMSIKNISFVSQTNTDRGYSLILFVLMYLWGGYIRKYGFFEKKKWVTPLMPVLCIMGTFFGILLNGKLNVLFYYDNILVVLQAISVFVVFTKIKLQSKFINLISKATFGIYLSHAMAAGLILHFVPFEKMLTGNLLYTAICYIVVCVGAFVLSAITELVRKGVLFPFIKRWEKTGIYKIEIVVE